MFKGIGNLGNIGSMLKQAQEMGSRMQEMNDKLKLARASGSSGGGLVTAEVNGLGELLRIEIDPSLIEKQDRELMEDLIPAAVNQALVKVKEDHANAMKEMTGGMNLPGLDEAMQSITGGMPSGDDDGSDKPIGLGPG